MTQFADDWNSDLAIELGPVWMQRGLMNGGFIEVDELVDARARRGEPRCERVDPVRHHHTACARSASPQEVQQ